MEKLFTETLKNKIETDQKRIIDVLDIAYTGELQDVPISQLVRPKYSSRVVIDNKKHSLTENFKNYGFLGGIFVADSSYHVIDGWQRTKIWEEMGHTIIPCYTVTCDEKQERELHLKLNTQLATFNIDDFGINFKDFNLIEDFGFCEMDIKSAPNLTEFGNNTKSKPTLEGFTKLSTTISTESYQKLKAFKEDQKLAQLGDVIEFLIERI